MVKIAFWDNGLGERGTSVSLYNYAYYNEKYLGNESIIMYNTTHYSNDNEVIKHFTKNFAVYGVDQWSKVDNILLETKCDILYIIKAGDWDGQISNVCKTVVHCVFTCYMPHGNVYSSISDYIDNNNGKYSTVPHMINLPNHNNNMRNKLNIPDNAIVYGRHGGYEQFNIQYVKEIVYDIAKNNSHIYFIFVNTSPFCENLKNIIHLNKIIDLDEKTEFINTCDAMLWARIEGETFGLSIGEFSSKNKPIICTESIHANAHKHLLGNQAIWYNQDTLKDILVHFNKEEMLDKDWNAYKNFTPEKVMDIFKKVFID